MWVWLILTTGKETVYLKSWPPSIKYHPSRPFSEWDLAGLLNPSPLFRPKFSCNLIRQSLDARITFEALYYTWDDENTRPGERPSLEVLLINHPGSLSSGPRDKVLGITGIAEQYNDKRELRIDYSLSKKAGTRSKTQTPPSLLPVTPIRQGPNKDNRNLQLLRTSLIVDLQTRK